MEQIDILIVVGAIHVEHGFADISLDLGGLEIECHEEEILVVVLEQVRGTPVLGKQLGNSVLGFAHVYY